MSGNINLDVTQSITNADVVLDSTIADLRDNFDYRWVNTIIHP